MPSNKDKKGHTKVRSGCGTCKIRKVKCDEGWPLCKRCTSTGRRCDGYQNFRQIHRPGSDDAALVTRKQPSVLPGSTDMERCSIDFFLGSMLEGFGGVFADRGFSSFLVQTLSSELIVRHAILAVGSAQKMLLTQSFQSRDVCFALQHYGETVRHLKNGLDGSLKSARTDALLLACILLACFEYLRRRYGTAIYHLNGGFRMLECAWKDADKIRQGSTTRRNIEASLVRAFQRLDMANSFFTSTKPVLRLKDQMSSDADLAQPKTFATINEARKALRDWSTEVIYFNIDVDSQLHTSMAARPRDSFARARVRQARLQRASKQWFEAFNSLTESRAARHLQMKKVDEQAKAFEMLHILALTLSIVLDTLLSDGRECIFDDFFPDFEKIVRLAESYTSTQSATSPFSYTCATYAFSTEIGVLAPLLHVGSKCRDPALRRKVVDILRMSCHREGPWEAEQVAMCVTKITQLEEGKARALRDGAPVQCAADVPEAARVHHAYFDLDKSDDVIYRKQKLFSAGGEWVNYQDSVHDGPVQLAGNAISTMLEERIEMRTKLLN